MKYPIIVCLALWLCLAAGGSVYSQSAKHGEQSWPQLTSAMAPRECDCSDFNCDGIWNGADASYISDYLFGGGPPPVNGDLSEVDWDGHETLTINDIVLIWHYIFSEGWPSCPPSKPALVPEVDSTYILYYSDYIPGGGGSAAIHLTIKAPGLYDFGYSLPLRIRINGNIPAIDSVTSDTFHFPSPISHYAVYPDSGCLAIGVANLWLISDTTYRIATIHVTVPENPNIQYVTMEWVNLPPVQSPIPDSTVIPMAVSFYGGGVEPLLIGHCCRNPGDANEDGYVNVGDAVYLIGCVFKYCPPPLCPAHQEFNCDGAVNVGDIVYLINHIFRGGPAPSCCF